ncbi:MAG: hypothetical protein RL367_2313 [Pseudomonadota bacterium]
MRRLKYQEDQYYDFFHAASLNFFASKSQKFSGHWSAIPIEPKAEIWAEIAILN